MQPPPLPSPPFDWAPSRFQPHVASRTCSRTTRSNVSFSRPPPEAVGQRCSRLSDGGGTAASWALPEIMNSSLLPQVLLSIQTEPAEFAARHLRRRCVLVLGDSTAMETAADLATILHGAVSHVSSGGKQVAKLLAQLEIERRIGMMPDSHERQLRWGHGIRVRMLPNSHNFSVESTAAPVPQVGRLSCLGRAAGLLRALETLGLAGS